MASSLNAVITGGGSGLGRALALDVARRGGRVVIADIDEVGATETARQVERAGSQAHVVRCDVARAGEVEALAERARELLGDVDLLANNAGVAVGGSFESIEPDDWRWIVDINLWGVVHGCRAFLPAMKARGRGHVLNVASMAGLLSFPNMAPYNVTKAGVVALSESLHSEYRASGVHVTVLCPTFFTTNILERGRIQDERGRAAASKAMRKSRVQAPEVARVAIDGVLEGKLYVVPMRDGRILWHMQRLSPERFYRWLVARVRSSRRFN